MTKKVPFNYPLFQQIRSDLSVSFKEIVYSWKSDFAPEKLPELGLEYLSNTHLLEIDVVKRMKSYSKTDFEKIQALHEVLLHLKALKHKQGKPDLPNWRFEDLIRQDASWDMFIQFKLRPANLEGDFNPITLIEVKQFPSINGELEYSLEGFSFSKEGINQTHFRSLTCNLNRSSNTIDCRLEVVASSSVPVGVTGSLQFIVPSEHKPETTGDYFHEGGDKINFLMCLPQSHVLSAQAQSMLASADKPESLSSEQIKRHLTSVAVFKRVLDKYESVTAFRMSATHGNA